MLWATAVKRASTRSRVKAAERQDTADAVTGTVTVEALGYTRELKSDAAGKVKWCEPLLVQSAKFKKGDKLRITCDWMNTTDHPMTFPEEMCVAFGMFFPATSDVDCGDGQWAGQ